jgi:hypothetical protein
MATLAGVYMKTEELAQRLEVHPALKKRVEELLAIAEGSMGNEEILRADDAEECIIAAVRETGRTVLHQWAEQRASRTAEQVETRIRSAKKHIKKKSTG